MRSKVLLLLQKKKKPKILLYRLSTIIFTVKKENAYNWDTKRKILPQIKNKSIFYFNIILIIGSILMCFFFFISVRLVLLRDSLLSRVARCISFK